MKDNIIIIGTGQHAKVVLYNAQCQGVYNVVGFIAKNQELVGSYIEDVPVLGTEETIGDIILKYNIKGYVLGVGNIKLRRKLIDFYDKTIKIKPITIIHPSAIISKNAKIGNGTLIECMCQITPNPIIGAHCVVNTMTGINHDNIIGENVYLASGVTLSGGVNISDDTLIDDGVTITLGRKIGYGCIIGAGSVVTKDIKDNTIAYGVPAKIIRGNF